MGRACCCKLQAENCQLCRENAALKHQIAALENRFDSFRAALESTQRQAKGQAAPFTKGEPKNKPKKPVRKRGKRYGTKARLEPR